MDLDNKKILSYEVKARRGEVLCNLKPLVYISIPKHGNQIFMCLVIQD